ncbi:hypothetical protein [Bradyrhizobium sp.]|uniref:hypothetical protein n=1 Tax=Bradyrhizobium sp. TaxID=376 RepID=UPI003C4B9B96
MFARTAEHLNALALEIEKTIVPNGTGAAPNGAEMARAADREEPVATASAEDHHQQAARPHQQAARPRRMLAWALVIVLGGIVGALFWINTPAKQVWAFMSSPASHDWYWPLSVSRSNRAAAPAPADETKQDDAKQAIAKLLSDRQKDRQILMEQIGTVGALAARVDNLERALDKFKTAGAGNTGLSAPEEKAFRAPENRAVTLENPAPAQPSDGAPRATGGPMIEPADRSAAAPSRQAELDPHKPVIGPLGCTQFRSFDPVSGMYTALDGQRRRCR